MQVKVRYDHGKIEFIESLQLKHDHLMLIVEVPDEELLPAYTLPEEVIAKAKEMEDKLDRIRNAPLPNENTLPPLTSKQEDRIEAFALREEVRKERGYAA